MNGHDRSISAQDHVVRKRKTLDDFYGATVKPTTSGFSQLTSRRPEGNVDPCSVPGLELHRDYISAAEERDILTFLHDPSQCTWRTDLSRRTMHFGGTYCLMPAKGGAEVGSKKPQILQAPDMPDQLSWLIDRMVTSGVFDEDRRPQYCIVNEYTNDNGISAHTENFQFGEPVVGLSLLATCPIRFHELVKPFDGSVRSGKAAKAEKTGRRVDLQLPGRSLMVMRGPSRWKWQHEIVKSKRRGAGWKRISLTFRWKPSSIGKV